MFASLKKEAKTLFWLTYCEKKTPFQLENEVKETGL